MMDKICEELDDAKAEIDKLRAESRAKAELFENLKRAHDKQLNRIQEIGLELEKQREETYEKEHEVSVVTQKLEDLKRNLNEKDGIIVRLSCANDKLRADHTEKIHKYEEENRDLVYKLEEIAINADNTQKIRRLEEEIASLNDLLASEMKRAGADQLGKASKELRHRDDILLKLEEENGELKDQLKRTKEQFQHLKESHEKLRADHTEKIHKYEEENRDLIYKLEEENAINMDSKQKIQGLEEQIAGLKGFLSASEMKCAGTEELGKASKELRHRDDIVLKLEEENGELKDQLKRKKEQFQHLKEAHEKLRADHTEKIHKYEEEIRDLVYKLEEENATNMDSKQKIQRFEEQIAGLKGFLSASEMKSAGTEELGKASKELRHRDDILLKLEEENGDLKDQLKRKKEQFQHLREAHEKLRDQLQAQVREWEKEKSTMLDGMDRLENNLDSQTRISKDLESRLQMCNQALAHEETCRKHLEVQLLESRTCFDNVFTECEEAKMKLETLSGQRDKEIATLRDLLGIKEAFYKEKEYRVRRLEEENQELKSSLKEFQEAQIQDAANSSLISKLRNKLKGLEQIHKDCSTKLIAREAEWISEKEKLVADLNYCRYEQKSKEELAKELKVELEGCHSLITELMSEIEESSIMLLVLKSELTETELKLADENARKNLKDMKSQKNLSLLKQQLEQIHGEYSTKFIVKEAEWKCEKGKLIEDLNCCRSEQVSKGEPVEELKVELEGYHSLIMQLMLQIEESSLMLLVLKSELKEAHLKLADEKAEKDLKDMEHKKNLSLLKQQLEMKNTALFTALKDAVGEHEKVESLTRRIESFNFIEQQQLSMKNDLNRYKEMVADSSSCQKHLKEQILQLKSDSDRAYAALDRANEELAQKFCEVNEAEFELQIWKSIAERLKADLEESYHLRKEVEASLLEQVAVEVALKQERENLLHVLGDKDGRIDDLQRQVKSLNEEHKLREGLEHVLEEKDRVIGDLQQMLDSLNQKLEMKETGAAASARTDLEKEIEWWEEEWLRKELERAIFEQIDVERKYDHENKNLHQLVDKKGQRFVDLQQHVSSLEQEFEDSTSSIIKMLEETTLLHEAWEKFTTTVILKELEIQERVLMIAELENDLSHLHQKLELQERTFSSSSKEREHIEVELKVKEMELKNMVYQLEAQLRISGSSIKNLENDNRKLIENVKQLSSENESLLGTTGELFGRCSELYSEDMHLLGSLGRIVKNFDDGGGMGRDLKEEDEFFDSVKENLTLSPSPMTKKIENQPLAIPSNLFTDERSPLRAINS